MKATFSQEYQTQNLETTQRQNSRPQIINQDQQITQEMVPFLFFFFIKPITHILFNSNSNKNKKYNNNKR